MRRRRVEATIAPSFFDIQNKNMKPQTLYDKLSDEDRKTLQAPINALAEDLSQLRGTLGLK